MTPVYEWSYDELRGAMKTASDRYGASFDNTFSELPSYVVPRNSAIKAISGNEQRLTFHESALGDTDIQLWRGLMTASAHAKFHPMYTSSDPLIEPCIDKAQSKMTALKDENSLFSPADQLSMALENLTDRLNQASITINATPHLMTFGDVLYPSKRNTDVYRPLIPTAKRFVRQLESSESAYHTPVPPERFEDLMMSKIIQVRNRRIERKYRRQGFNPVTLVQEVIAAAPDTESVDRVWHGDDTRLGLRRVASEIEELQNGERPPALEYDTRMNVAILEALKLKYWAERFAKDRLKRLGGAGLTRAIAQKYPGVYGGSINR